MTSIAISDVGPIEEFRLDMDQPGLWVLRGQHGAGKTTILRTVQLATDGRADIKPTKRDGAKKGEATVAGKTVRIAKQIREEGDLTVDGLGDLDIAALHSPKFLDAVTRDRHRIKVLVRLAGVMASAPLFHNLIGGKEQFESIVNADALETDDLVEMAARVKRALEREALGREGRRDTALAEMRVHAQRVESVDLSAPHDEAALQAALTAAVEHRSRLVQQQKAGTEVRERAAEARRQLAALAAGQTAAEADAKLDDAEGREREAAKRVAALEHQLSEARADLAVAQEQRRSAEAALEAAKRQESLTAKWRADIEAAEAVECPTPEAVWAAENAVALSQKNVQTGLHVREALKARDEAERMASLAKKLDTEAKRLRGAAHDTQDVLSDAIASIEGCPLRVVTNEDGDVRLVVNTDRSEAEPFDELSDGERWPYIIRLAAGPNRMIVLPQAAFGELSEQTRKQLHDLAAQHGCFILTAQVDDGALRGERYRSEAFASAAA